MPSMQPSSPPSPPSTRSRLVRLRQAFARRLWPAVTAATVVMLLAAVLLMANASAGGLTVRFLSPSSSAHAAQAATPSATASPADTPTPTAAPTATATPLPTSTPVPPVVTATFTCAHAQSVGPGGDPGTYMGEICVHTAPNSPISVDVSFCGVHAAQVISGMTTDGSGNWALASNTTATDPWTFKASCAIPFTVDLAVRGNTPSGEAISGSTSITVTQ